MAEEFFYHFTTQEAAKDIFLSGEILPSLAVNGDAVHGDGVYLMTLNPGLGKDTVKSNNWDGIVGNMDEKMDVFFEIIMPSSKIKRARRREKFRSHPGALQLSDYKWSLKNWKGELLATQHFMVSSEGKAAEEHPELMSKYTTT